MKQTRRIDQTEAYLLAANLMRGQGSVKQTPEKASKAELKLDIVHRYIQSLRQRKARQS